MISLIDNSKESQKYRNHLYNLLHSDDESNINLAVQVLWDLEIPEEWLVFLFQKSRDNNSIKKLLQKHFPPREFEVAFQWFSLIFEDEQAKNLDLLIQLPKLHQAFTWENILPTCFPEHRRMGSNLLGEKTLQGKLLTSPEVPNQEIIPLLIDDNNTLRLPRSAKKIPAEIGNFPKIKDILHFPSQNTFSFDLPFTITRMDNLGNINIQCESLILYDDMTIEGLPFMDVLKEHNPQLLIRLLFNRYIQHEITEEDLLSRLKGIELDKRLSKLLKIIDYSDNQTTNKLELWKELYEQEDFYNTKIGYDIYRFIGIGGSESTEYLITFLEKQERYKIEYRNYAYANLILILDHYKDTLKCFEISKKTYYLLEDKIYKSLFRLLTTVFFFKLNDKHPLLPKFKNIPRFEQTEDTLLNCQLGFITFDETLNQLEYFNYLIYKYDLKTDALLKKIEQEF